MKDIKNVWIRTDSGHAGRHGFVTKAPVDKGFKFQFTSYDLATVEFSDRVGDLKKFADGL